MDGGAIRALRALGQSIWYDNCERTLIASGRLAAMIRDDGLAGMTSNPTIFEKAVKGSDAYDAQLKALAARSADLPATLDAVIGDDIRAACDAFGPLFDASGGEDGRVSIEVSPALARDTAGTVREGVRLKALVDRPNVMIKVPATREGLPAITELTAAGVDVNVTLIFAVARYREVMDAFQAGLERRVAAGQAVDAIRSVASFFVSRIDVAAAKRLDPRIAAGETALAPLRGRVGIANSRRAWAAWEEVFTAPRWTALAARGARPQRVLWASTGVKDPALSPTAYVEALVGPHSVNTLPPETYAATRALGAVARMIDTAEARADRTLENLAAAGIGLDGICAELEVAGVKSFADSWAALGAALEAKLRAL